MRIFKLQTFKVRLYTIRKGCTQDLYFKEKVKGMTVKQKMLHPHLRKRRKIEMHRKGIEISCTYAYTFFCKNNLI